MKKRKVLACALTAVFVLLFALGVALNSQRGMYYGNQFWKLKDDGSYACGGDSILFSGDGKYELMLDGKAITARESSLPDGRTRMDFSDGWAVELDTRDDFFFVFGDYVGSDGDELILTDISKQDFRFAPAAREERSPFYDGESGEIIGETILTFSAEGEQLDWREIWFDHPEYSTPEREVVVLQDGVRLPARAAYSAYDCILQNADGEYLLDAYKLGRIRAGGVDTDRCGLTWFLLRIAQGEPVARGRAEPVIFFTIIYIAGAAQLLWPEKLAFFGSRWRYRNDPELSEEGMTAMYIGSVVVMLLGIAMLFAAIW